MGKKVYRARDTKLKREVAIEVLTDLFANDPERLARFQREAQVLAALNLTGATPFLCVDLKISEIVDAGQYIVSALLPLAVFRS